MSAHLLRHTKCALEKVMQVGTHTSDLDRTLISFFHLPKYLGLPEHHRVEARRNSVKMANGGIIDVLIENISWIGTGAQERLEELANAASLSTNGNYLKPVAGGDHCCF
jgi:hypothetical protein